MVGIVYVRPYRVAAFENFIAEYIKTVLKLNRYSKGELLCNKHILIYLNC